MRSCVRRRPPRVSSHRLRTPIVVTEAERAGIESIGSEGSAERVDAYLASVRQVDRMTSSFLRDMARVQLRRRAEDQIEAFRALSQRLSSLEGQKHVVVMTEGFEGYANDAVTDSMVYLALRDMDRAFQQSDVFLHTLDLEGLQMTPAIEDAHHLLSAGTGGMAYTNRNDLAGSLASLSGQLSIGYRLGFRPQKVRAGHNTVRIKVRSGRGLSIRHRLGFSGTPQTTDTDEGLYLADVVLNDVPQTGTAATLELGKGVLHARVPMQPLAAQLGAAGVADLLVYVFDQNGKAIAFHEQKIRVPAGATGETTLDIPLPPGAKVAKALLRVDDSVGFTKITS